MTSRITVTIEDEVLENLDVFVEGLDRRKRSYVVNLAVKEFLSNVKKDPKYKLKELIRKTNEQTKNS